ncbi:MAG TPA: substrate-binding domain-containing protein [Anaeromyxobacter sp.]|nr:substrate-binding domain-containing protein [Anaeromyxobacter sp.]
MKPYLAASWLGVIFAVALPLSRAEGAGKETYVWACQYQSLPLFVNNDYYGLDDAAKELNVNVEKIGPQKIDLPAFIASIEQEIVKKPAGMMVVGWDPSLGVAIDKAIDAGIPVITIDADVPNSKRLAFVGTDWYELGAEQAKAVAPFLKGKTGKAAIIGIAAADNTVLAKAGYIDTLKRLAPGITVMPNVFDSQSNASVVASTISNLIRSNADLLAVAGTDSTTGPGIATAIRETGKIGKIAGSCVDAEAEHLQGVKEGSLIAAVGQKRQFFTYYGVKMLFDYNHTPVKFTANDRANHISDIPSKVSTGFIVATKDNVDALIEAAKARSANK